MRSEGELDPFSAEVADGYHTIEWLVTQGWCNGAIGLFGDSHYGFTQWAAASSGHPALGAIAPRATSADMTYALDRAGVFQLESTAAWCLHAFVDEALYDYEDQLDWSVRPLSEVVPAVLGGARPVGLDAHATGHVPRAASVPVTGRVPALHLGGFFDFLLPGQLASWRQATTVATTVALDLAGPVELSATISSSCGSTHLVATLCDVHPDGTTSRILDGAILVRGPWPAPVRLHLGDTGYRLQPGHRLRLTLAGSGFPRYVLHPGTDEHPWTAVVTRPTDNQIQLGGSGAATLTAHHLPEAAIPA